MLFCIAVFPRAKKNKLALAISGEYSISQEVECISFVSKYTGIDISHMDYDEQLQYISWAIRENKREKASIDKIKHTNKR